jgi:hypothetical protein
LEPKLTTDDPISETAKATQEIAKTTSKVIDTVEKFGEFISKYVHGSIQEGMGIFEDKLKYMRWERQMRFMQRAQELSNKLGLTNPLRPIPLNLALPLLQAASMEEDDYLQDLWARLLVNGSNSNSGTTLTRAYISILEQLTPFEARLLHKIYSLPYSETQHKGVDTGKLPDEVSIGKDDGKENELVDPPENVKLGLANLARVGCIVIQKSWGGGEIFKQINPTLLGKTFIEACSN